MYSEMRERQWRFQDRLHNAVNRVPPAILGVILVAFAGFGLWHVFTDGPFILAPAQRDPVGYTILAIAVLLVLVFGRIALRDDAARRDAHKQQD